MSALPDRNPVEDILRKVNDVAVLPQVVYKVIELTGKSDTSAADIERIIAVDPGFSARVLQIVNSAYYCLPRQVGSVKDAVLFIGLTALRQLATTIGVFDLFMGKSDKESLRRRGWWRHSLDAAVSCRLLAAEHDGVNADEAYAAALLHDMGKTMLDRHGRGKYEHVEALIASRAGVIDAERAVFGVDHCTVGRAVTMFWRFPSFLTDCAGFHHVPGPDAENPELCSLVAIASTFAAMHESQADAVPHEAIPSWAATMLGLSAERIDTSYTECCSAIDETTGLSGVL
jgi:HD-like signal output (HDOD) protein